MSRLRLLIIFGLIGCTVCIFVVVGVMRMASREMLCLLHNENAASPFTLEMAAAVPTVMMGVLTLGMLVSLVAGVLIGILFQISSQPKSPGHPTQLSPGQPVYTYRPRRRLPPLGSPEESWPAPPRPQLLPTRLNGANRPGSEGRYGAVRR